MKIAIYLLLSFLLVSACAKERKSAPVTQKAGPPPAAVAHLPPDAPTEELTQTFEAFVPAAERTDRWRELAAASKRVFDWQAQLNSRRGPENRLRFDRNPRGIPIEDPMEYNEQTVKAEFQAAIQGLTPEMRAVITNPEAPFPTELTTSDSEFETLGNKVIKAYDHATRWDLLSPYLDHYKAESAKDVRGAYFLLKESGLESKLAGWGRLKPEVKAKLRPWLLGLCRNDRTAEAACLKELRANEARGVVTSFFRRHITAGRQLLDYYFRLDVPRTDVRWFSQLKPSGPLVPFTRPEKESSATFVKTTLENGWKGDGWQLRINFTPGGGEDTTHVVYASGVLPHVNKLGGSEITMDENIPVDNELNTSVFTHEFGHVLGFPDCYVEFYDGDRQVMVNYQIDVSNIMCSRKGKVMDLHRDGLKKAYEKTR